MSQMSGVNGSGGNNALGNSGLGSVVSGPNSIVVQGGGMDPHMNLLPMMHHPGSAHHYHQLMEDAEVAIHGIPATGNLTTSIASHALLAAAVAAATQQQQQQQQQLQMQQQQLQMQQQLHKHHDVALESEVHRLQHEFRSVDGITLYRCSIKECKCTFEDYGDLKDHLAHHFKCTIVGCEKAYSSASHLRRHQRVHTADKPYACGRCGRSFFLAHHLAYHERTHTGEKPYQCQQPGCNKTYSQPGDYYRHLRKHTGKTPYVCDHAGCTRSFIRGRDLENHKKKTHSPEAMPNIASIGAM